MNAQEIVEKLTNLSKVDPKLSSLNNIQDESKLLNKDIYNLLKTEEAKLGISSSKNVLPSLHITNMSAEQIWQQIEFHNQTVITMSTDELTVNESNLCVKIADLSSKIDDDGEEDEEEEEETDDGVETGGEETEGEKEKIQDRTSDFEDDDVLSKRDDQTDDIPDDLSEFSDLDKDTFGDIALEEEEDDDDDEDDDNDNNDDNNDNNENKDDDNENNDDIDDDNEYKVHDEEQHNNTLQLKNSKSFKSSLVDSQFFNLRESEWIADNDVIGKSFGDEVDLNWMEDEDGEQSNDEGVDAMYDAFFDPPSSEPSEPVQEIQEPTEEDKMKSKFETAVAKEISLQEQLEKETYLTEKPWIQKGEVQKTQRPENSTLEQYLEYNVAVRQKPIITAETTQNIEKLILDRIRSKCWDDVERKIKPIADPFQFKQKLILDEEKGKKSLASIYEEEYMRKQEELKSSRKSLDSLLAESDEKWEELPAHREIKKEMDDLFMKLDALSNCHFTPKYTAPEIKIVSNLPAVIIEEATPATVSTASLLAPQEVVAPLRGDLKGETEKDKTDKQRERRGKKKHQKARAEREEAKLKHQMKKRGRDGMINTEASIKIVEKAAKQGHIKALDGEQNSVKSSKKFFDQLQNNVAERTNKKRKRDFKDETGKKKKKNKKPLTMAQLLL